MKKYYRVGEAAKIIGVGASALRSYTNNGLIECSRNPAGQRLYTMEQINAYLGESAPQETVYYVRSSDGDKVKMGNQVSVLTLKYGEPLKVYSDRGSGLSDSRKGLETLLKHAQQGKFNRVCITQKDRLTRFGYRHLVELLNVYGVEVEVLGEDDKLDLNEELMRDFMSLIASFSGKFYRLRGYKQQRQLLEAAESRISEKQGS